MRTPNFKRKLQVLRFESAYGEKNRDEHYEYDLNDATQLPPSTL